MGNQASTEAAATTTTTAAATTTTTTAAAAGPTPWHAAGDMSDSQREQLRNEILLEVEGETPLNIDSFGQPAAGKSSLLTRMKSLYANRWTYLCPVGVNSTTVTSHITKYPIVPRAVFGDVPGVNKTNFQGSDQFAVDYIGGAISQAVDLRAAYDHNVATADTVAVPIDALLLVISAPAWDAKNTPPYFQCVIAEARNRRVPIVIALTKIDELPGTSNPAGLYSSPEIAAIRNAVAKGLGIPKQFVFPVCSTYDDPNMVTAHDILVLELMVNVINFAADFRCSHSATV